MKQTKSILRRKSIAVDVSGVSIGGGAPIVVQSMTNTDTADIDATARQDVLREAIFRGSGVKTGEFFLPALLDMPLDASIRPIRRSA